MANLPGRTSDAGPHGRPDCPTCRSTKWATLSYCARCNDTCCSECAIDAAKGLYCALCVKSIVNSEPVEDWPELATFEEVQAIVRYANIPEWLEPVNEWVN